VSTVKVRNRAQFPLTKRQEQVYEGWVRRHMLFNGSTYVVARASVSASVNGEYRYWAEEAPCAHFCSSGTLEAGRQRCFGCSCQCRN
jgi:hypothetical protein